MPDQDSKSRSGRFDLPANELVEQFNATITFEQRCCPYDVKNSQAHATMLGRQAIIPAEDAQKIVAGLETVGQEIAAGSFEFSIHDEDIHMAIEKRMTEIVGPVGGRLHTGRSRNDQCATTTKMWLRGALPDVMSAVAGLQKEILELARENKDVIMPGFTHMQTAQPVLFSHWIMAYFWMLERDFTRFEDLQKRSRFCPLGSAALAGTDFPIDRAFTAKQLGFEAPTENSMDSVSDRDHFLEFLSDAALCFVHLSRLCEEIVMMSTQEFHFLELSDDFCTGSSIMPQKKNPDIAEKIRGKSGRMFGNLMSLLTTMKGIPMAYNTDLSEDKEPVFDSFDTLVTSLKILTPMIAKMKLKKEVMRDAAGFGYANATDLADYLTKKGLPFREAHHIVGAMVNFGIKHSKQLEEFSIEEYKSFSDKIEEDVRDAIRLDTCVKARRSYGGTGPEPLAVQLDHAASALQRECEVLR